MIESILQIIIENKDFLEKSLERSIKAHEISMFSGDLNTVFQEAGRKIITEIAENLDEAIFKSAKRKKEYEPKDIRHRNIMVIFGNTQFKRRCYKDKRTGEYICLTDEMLGIEKYNRLDKSVESKIIELANDVSYAKSGKQAIVNEKISKTTVMNKLRKNELKVDVEIKEKTKKKILYIEADEDHVSTVGDKISMPKLIYIHEGRLTIGKRNVLKNVHYIGCLGKNSEEVWLEVAEYIDKKYDTEILETVYLSGDGAAWIKEGLNWIEKSKFVLDRYHLNKYILKATVLNPEYRSKLWFAINACDPISVRNIFKELIRITENENKKEEIKESMQYIFNQWTGIEIYETEGENLVGCSAEGHISHVFADRMSSRPRTWSEDGIDKMARLRTFTSNGGNVYEKLIKTKLYNKKLEKYDKIIARNIKKGITTGTGTKLPAIEYGKNSGLRKQLEYILYA